MKLIKPSVEILEQGPGLQGIYDMIELCGKTSYKSEVKGGEEAKKFVDARVNEGHYAVLEFGTVYLKMEGTNDPKIVDLGQLFFQEPYSRVTYIDGYDYITTNMRVLVEKGLTRYLKYQCEPTEYHTRRYAARIITDRGVTHELVRHRTFSFCQESTRYCNYSKDKFGNELTFILPSWFYATADNVKVEFNKTLATIEKDYMELLNTYCWTPQQARQILPNAIKTEICVCGFEDAWKHFFDLRYRGTTGKPHPDMLNVSTMLHKEFEAKGISL